MFGFGIFVVVLLSWCFQTGQAEIALSPKIVYDLLSSRIDSVIRESHTLKSDLAETKAVVDRIEQKIERLDANMTSMASKSDISEREKSQSVLTVKDKHFDQDKLKTETLLVRKMLFNEKSYIRKTMMAFENKFKKFQSDVVKHMTHMNNSMESKVDKIEHSLSEHKTDVDKRTTLSESYMESSFKETNMTIQDISAHLDSKLTETMMAIENKYKKFQSDVVKHMTHMNNSMESKVDKIEHSLSEHKTDVDKRTTLSESYMENSFKETNMTIQKISAHLDSKLTESDNKTKQIRRALTGNITTINHRLSAVDLNLASMKTELNGRLNNAESQLRIMSSKLGKVEIHIPENGYLVGKTRSVILNGETYQICCENGFEVESDGFNTNQIETCKTIRNDYGLLEPNVQCSEERCDPLKLINGFAKYENNSRIWSKIGSGQSIFLYCDNGFEFYDNRGQPIQTTQKRQCKKGKITDTPTCIEKKCPLAVHPSNPYTHYRDPNTVAQKSTSDYVEPGKSIEVYCDKPYELYKSNSKTIVETQFITRCRRGVFNQDTFPVCFASVLDPVQAQGDNQRGYYFGATNNSRLEYDILPLSIKFKMVLTLEFRTTKPNGIIFYSSDTRHEDHVSLTMTSGKIRYTFNCGTGTGVIITSKTYNDGQWHELTVRRVWKTGLMTVDGDNDQIQSVVAPGRARTVNFRLPYNFGGLKSEMHDAAKKNLNGVTNSFPGCIANITMRDKDIGSPSEIIGIQKCSDFAVNGYLAG